MIDKKEISSLIYLLDDSDEEVIEQIESKNKLQIYLLNSKKN